MHPLLRGEGESIGITKSHGVTSSYVFFLPIWPDLSKLPQPMLKFLQLKAPSWLLLEFYCDIKTLLSCSIPDPQAINSHPKEDFSSLFPYLQFLGTGTSLDE